MKLITQHCIDGAFVDSHGQETLDLINPSTQAVVGRVTLGDEEDTRRAISAAKQAFKIHAKTSPAERAEMLQRLHDAVATRAPEHAQALVQEYGAPSQMAQFFVHTATGAILSAKEALDKVAFTRMIDQAEVTLHDLSGDPLIGLRLAAGLERAAMPPSFMVAYHARDFRDASQRVARFKRLCAPEEVELQEHGDRVEVFVTWTHAEGVATPPALVDATLVALMELGRKGTATALAALDVELARPESFRTDYERYFGCHVRFGAAIDRSFVGYNAELLEILIPELDRRLGQHSHGATVGEQIRWVLRRRLTAGRPDIRSIATELAMSERSLQRRLTDEGLTFQSLLRETRHRLALDYLSDPTLALIEVAYMLGYEDQNSFFRAFRQWEDLPPAAWRARQAQSQGLPDSAQTAMRR